MAQGEQRHADEDILERYSMGQLRGPENDAFEEHLLICEQCRDAVASMDSYVGAMRTAAGELRRAPQAAKAPWIERLFHVPKPAWAFAFAAAAILMVVGIGYPTLWRTASPAVVVLEANRGAGETNSIAAPAGKPLELVLDLNGVAALPSYRVEIVDAGGRALFQPSAAPQGGKLQVTVGRGFPEGAYFVRVYGPDQSLLREYALRVVK